MRLMTLTAALAFSLMTAAPAVAQSQQGVSVSAARDWISGLGGQVGEIEREGRQVFFSVKDGDLTWFLVLNGCQADAACGDATFLASFTNPDVTLDKVNAWNSGKRFLKAHYEPAGADGQATAVVQFDLILHPDQGMDQMGDPLAVWIETSREFATHIGYFSAQ